MGYMRFRMCKLIIRREGSCQFNRFLAETGKGTVKVPFNQGIMFLFDQGVWENELLRNKLRGSQPNNLRKSV